MIREQAVVTDLLLPLRRSEHEMMLMLLEVLPLQSFQLPYSYLSRRLSVPGQEQEAWQNTGTPIPHMAVQS